MKYFPDQALEAFIDGYWIVKNANTFFADQQRIIAYPGVTPEMLIVLGGSFSYQYKGRSVHTSKSTVFSFIEENLIFDPSELNAFVIVQFKPLGLFSLRQFVAVSSKVLMTNPIRPAEALFTIPFFKLVKSLKHGLVAENVLALDQFFLKCLNRKPNSFVEYIAKSLKNGVRLKDLELPYATIERHFKTETGLTPKKFQLLQRYKWAIQEIYKTHNDDWIHYVEKYNYYDQSHFIKEIKQYTSFTPAQLCSTPALLNYRNMPK